MRAVRLLSFLLVTGLLAASSRVETSPHEVAIARRLLDAKVDSEDADLYRDWLLRDDAPEDGQCSPVLPPRLARLDRLAASSVLDRDQLRILTHHHSVDLATLLFARSVLADPSNAALQTIFDAELARDGVPTLSIAPTTFPRIVFAPGFLYRSHPETGGDFAVPRRHLSSLGIAHELVATDESGSIEDNAARIAATLRRLRGHPVIVVSASKAGPEVALAVGRLLAPGEVMAVAAWINIGGLLGGSPLADRALRPPRRWLVRAALWWKHLDIAGVRSLRTSESRRRLSALRLPPALPIINLVPAPLSGSVSERAADGYRRLRSLGPNDGLALLADQILPGSRTLLQLGDDHFLTRTDPRVLTLALLSTARQLITPASAPVQSHQRALLPAPDPSIRVDRKR